MRLVFVEHAGIYYNLQEFTLEYKILLYFTTIAIFMHKV